jgi:hypothetical protein
MTKHVPYNFQLQPNAYISMPVVVQQPITGLYKVYNVVKTELLFISFADVGE